MADIVRNPKARRDYHVLETVEAGIALSGTEVKSLRAGLGQIRDSYAKIEKGEMWLFNAYIEEYTHGNYANHDPQAPRKLLLHKSEIKRLEAEAAVKGHALLPLSLYWKNGRVKLKLAVGKGKVVQDKRQDIRKREVDRQLQRITMHRQKGH